MKHRRDAGFSLAALIFFATAVSILMAAAVPAYKMQARRQMEEELIFRGEEYSRAIQKYQRKFGIYPPSIDGLIATNGFRFLRQPYKDPITGKDFRLITINPDGSLNGSTLLNQRINNTPLIGGTTQTSPQSQPQSQTQSQNQPGQQTQQNQPGQQGQQSQPGLRQMPGFSTGLANTGTQPTTPGGSSIQGTTPFGTTTGAGIVGVASDSKDDSIKVYNGRQKYNEWEFIAIPNQNNTNPGTPPPNTGQGTTNNPGNSSINKKP